MNSTVDTLLDRYGRTYSAELGIRLADNTPAPLFQWLCAGLLLSARISSDIAMNAAGALKDAGWTTARKMADSTWEERVRALNHAGYARYDESTARMLGDTVEHLIEAYDGDLRRLREAAGKDPGSERQRLKACKGIGDVGVDILFRELQAVWPELYPFADRKALEAAERLDLPGEADTLSRLVDRKDFPRLVAALVRAAQAKSLDAVAEAAAAG